MRQDISKQDLYEGVKTLVENPNSHLHLDQHKLYTLFSIGFQYLLFSSTKNPGAYIIRVEDSLLAEKLARKSKDPSTRKFLQSLILPRKFTYGRSTFYLDFFHVSSWNLTKDIPPAKLKAALVVKNTSEKLMEEIPEDANEDHGAELSLFPEGYWYNSLQEVAPKTLLIAYEKQFEGVTPLRFDFIKKERERSLAGVRLSQEIRFDDME